MELIKFTTEEMVITYFREHGYKKGVNKHNYSTFIMYKKYKDLQYEINVYDYTKYPDEIRSFGFTASCRIPKGEDLSIDITVNHAKTVEDLELNIHRCINLLNIL